METSWRSRDLRPRRGWSRKTYSRGNWSKWPTTLLFKSVFSQRLNIKALTDRQMMLFRRSGRVVSHDSYDSIKTIPVETGRSSTDVYSFLANDSNARGLEETPDGRSSIKIGMETVSGKRKPPRWATLIGRYRPRLILCYHIFVWYPQCRLLLYIRGSLVAYLKSLSYAGITRNTDTLYTGQNHIAGYPERCRKDMIRHNRGTLVILPWKWPKYCLHNWEQEINCVLTKTIANAYFC